MELSKRLQAVADLLCSRESRGSDVDRIVADVGTDHGYIPIYLVESGHCKKAFAMDVNEGPLLRAQEHIAKYGLQEQIETRLSDGVQALRVGECDSVIVAGMGGALTVRILTEGEILFRSLKEFVLQPQSELTKVREYLHKENYRILAEDMVLEDGKFYPMMRVCSGQDEEYSSDVQRRAAEFAYGRCLLAMKHPVLMQFLEKEYKIKTEILSHLKDESGEAIEARRRELSEEISYINYALHICKNKHFMT